MHRDRQHRVLAAVVVMFTGGAVACSRGEAPSSASTPHEGAASDGRIETQVDALRDQVQQLQREHAALSGDAGAVAPPSQSGIAFGSTGAGGMQDGGMIAIAASDGSNTATPAPRMGGMGGAQGMMGGGMGGAQGMMGGGMGGAQGMMGGSMPPAPVDSGVPAHEHEHGVMLASNDAGAPPAMPRRPCCGQRDGGMRPAARPQGGPAAASPNAPVAPTGGMGEM